MKQANHPFLSRIGRMLNAGATRALILSGNIHDLFGFADGNGVSEYLPLSDLLVASWKNLNRVLITYELNGPIRFVNAQDQGLVRDAWSKWRSGMTPDELAIKRLTDPKVAEAASKEGDAFDEKMRLAQQNPTYALEFLRQLCLCSRMLSEAPGETNQLSRKGLVIIIERADMIIPAAEISRLSDNDRHRVAICHDWFSDLGFTNGRDSVVLIAESRSLISREIATLPQIEQVEILSPDSSQRKAFIEWFQTQEIGKRLKLWSSVDELAKFTGGLSIHALRQLLISACYDERQLESKDVVAKVEAYIQAEIGDDVVEFKRPTHSLADVIGFSRLKTFIADDLIPRLRLRGSEAISGVIVCGPIGTGKTFIFEAVATEMDMVVLVLKNIRSMWYGQTDVVWEKLRRVLMALDKVIIFVDEADAEVSALGPEAHSTEKRLTGRIQAMMSDTSLRGRVFWFLLTARIHRLSPDLRRPGRADYIVPVFDPTGRDRQAFLQWAIRPALDSEVGSLEEIDKLTAGYSTASFAALRSDLKAKMVMLGRKLTWDEVMAVITDRLPPAISKTRQYQKLQALVNCSRRCLLPEDVGDIGEKMSKWLEELKRLELEGVS